jgi:ABC-type cobalamin/Fe3+-siderophores transport system ATPase subunit
MTQPVSPPSTLLANTPILLDVNGIEVIYNHVILVLKGVSLQVPEGKIVALLGANGAGKTTTLRAISNLLRGERGDVTKGDILYRGERIDRLWPLRLSGSINIFLASNSAVRVKRVTPRAASSRCARWDAHSWRNLI